MRQELRDICTREIKRINVLSEQKALDKEDIEKLKSLATALKTLEDSKTPEEDKASELLKVTSTEELFQLLDALEYGHGSET